MVVNPVLGKAVCDALGHRKQGWVANGSRPLFSCPNLLGERCLHCSSFWSDGYHSLDSVVLRSLHYLGPASLPLLISSQLTPSIPVLPACSPPDTCCFMALRLFSGSCLHTHPTTCCTCPSPEKPKHTTTLQSLPRHPFPTTAHSGSWPQLCPIPYRLLSKSLVNRVCVYLL